MKMTKTVCSVTTGALKRDITSSYESHNDGKRHFKVVAGPSVANCYGYPAYTAGVLWYEDQDGRVKHAVISAGSKELPANKVTCSGVARKLGFPLVARYLARNDRWGSVAVEAARKAAFDELAAHFNGEG
jgi:hypothetical protein